MDPERDETAAERLDRNWSELLQELRVTQTGVQLLSGFLLTLPFQSRFSQLDTVQRIMFLTAVVLATLATGLLVAPVSAHRMLFRRHEKDVIVAAADRLAKAGLIMLGLTVAMVLALIFSVVLGKLAALVAGGLALLLFGVCWIIYPRVLTRSHRTED